MMWATSFLAGVLFFNVVSTDSTTRNVLFLAADDMRPDIGVYNANNQNSPNMYTPNQSCLRLFIETVSS